MSDKYNDMSSYKKTKRKGNWKRNLGFIGIIFGICVVMFAVSYLITYNMIKPSSVYSPKASSDSDLITENESLREQIGILQAQVDTMEAQLERNKASGSNVPPAQSTTSGNSSGSASTGTNQTPASSTPTPSSSRAPSSSKAPAPSETPSSNNSATPAVTNNDATTAPPPTQAAEDLTETANID